MLSLLLGDTLVEELSVLVSSILGGLGTTALEGLSVALVLQTLRSDETLNLGSLGVWLLALALGLDLTTNDELSYIIILAETEESANARSTLGTQSLGEHGIGQSRDLGLALLDDGQCQHRQVHSHDTSTD